MSATPPVAVGDLPAPLDVSVEATQLAAQDFCLHFVEISDVRQSERGRPECLDVVLSADPSVVRYHAVQSVEGGRFFHTLYRHVVWGTDLLPEPPDHRWMALHQLTDLARHSHYINEQACSLLACLRAFGGQRRLSIPVAAVRRLVSTPRRRPFPDPEGPS